MNVTHINRIISSNIYTKIYDIVKCMLNIKFRLLHKDIY